METNKERQELQQNFKDMANDYNCIDEQTIISSIGVKLCCLKAAMNYRQTKEQLNALLSKSKGSAQITLQGDIIINTIDNKRLASEIVKEVKHHFGEPQNKLQNTEDKTLILTEAEEWKNDIKQTQYTPKQYAEFVDERFKRDYNLERLPQEVKEQFAQWVNTKGEQQPDTLNDEMANAQPDIMTDQAKKYYSKAVEAGFMTQTDNGYNWTFGNRRGAKAALSYFIMKIYSPDNTKIIHFKALEKLFNVNRLDSTLDAMLNTKQPQQWRSEIDELFND